MDNDLISWFVVILIVLTIMAFLVYRFKNFKTLIASLTISIAIPILNVRYECFQNHSSEACVWGKSYLSFSLGLIAVIGTPILYLLFSFLYWLYKKIIQSKNNNEIKASNKSN